MEFCNGGDLAQYLKAQQTPLKENLVWEWFTQLVAAMAYFHARNIIHRALKPANVLIHNRQIKIGDFGLASIVDSMLSMVTTSKSRGTALYMAPELFEDVAHFGAKSDVWGLACIVYEMCTLKCAFNSIAAIFNRHLAPIQGDYTSTLKDTVRKMLRKIVEERIDLAEILQLQQIRDNMTDALESVNNEEYNRPSTSNVIRPPALTTAQRKEFSLFDMSPLEPDNEGQYANANWKEFQLFNANKWGVIMNENEGLDFPPLHVLDERQTIVVILFARKYGNDFLFNGMLHQKMSTEVVEMTMRMNLRMEIKKSNGQKYVNEKDIVLNFINFDTCNNNPLFPFLQSSFVMYDIPWCELSTSIHSLAIFIRIRPTNLPMSRFSGYGLEAITSIDGHFGPIDCANIEGTVCNKLEWKRMVENDDDVRMLFPPLVVPRNIMDNVAVIIFAIRSGNDFKFIGGFHPNVDKNVNESNVAVTLGIQFHYKNGEIQQRTLNESISFRHGNNDVYYSIIFSLVAVHWNKMSSALPPCVTNISFKSSHARR